MNYPDLYRKVAVTSKREAKLWLEEFTINKRWRENATVLDLGCGDGSTNQEVLQKFVPASCKKIVGCDISEKMIDYAKTHYENELVEFLVWDVSEEPPTHLRGVFDHVFSFYVIHWVKNQEAAFLNIYSTLTDGGNCLLVFLGYHLIHEIFRTLSRTQKWGEVLKNVDSFVSPYYDSKDPKGEVTTLMEKVGFKDIQVKILAKTHTHDSVNTYKNLVKAINPFHELNENWDDFMKDYFELAPSTLRVNYDLIVAYGCK